MDTSTYASTKHKLPAGQAECQCQESVIYDWFTDNNVYIIQSYLQAYSKINIYTNRPVSNSFIVDNFYSRSLSLSWWWVKHF